MTAKFGLLGLGIFVGLVAVLAGWLIFGGPYQYQGSLIEPPLPAADFELQQAQGGTFRLSEQRDRVVLIFFGYTTCPDVCPVTLSEFRRVKQSLGDRAEGVRFVFVTVDPERDTPEKLARYVGNFDESFLALYGDPGALQQVYDDYGVYVEKTQAEGAAGYLVDHTARVYAVDKQGSLRLTYPFGMEVEKMAEDVAHLLAE